MPNDKMPNYGVQTQYVSIFQLGLQARNVTNQRKIITTDRTALFSKPVKCQQQRGRRKEKRRKKKRRQQKRRARRKNRLHERESLHFTDDLSEKFV